MEHTIKLTKEQLGIVGAGLAELPFKVAQPLMAAIQAQLEAAQVGEAKAAKRKSNSDLA